MRTGRFGGGRRRGKLGRGAIAWHGGSACGLLAVAAGCALWLAAAAGAARNAPAPPRSATALPVLSLQRTAAYADRGARFWQTRLDAQGRLHDALTGTLGRSYGPTMIGYAMLRAGLRSGDARLATDGLRAIDARTHVPVRLRGVFDLLGLATAYNYARAHLATDVRFTSVRAVWAHYLRTSRAPHESPLVHGCIVSPTCFHNHLAVGALADVALYATGLHSGLRGALLSDRPRLLSAAVKFASRTAPRFERGHASSSGPGPRTGLGLLSDSTLYPLAYDSLCAAMLGQVVARLGPAAPPAARRAARVATETLGAFMSPTGDSSYIGRRQGVVWSLAASVLEGTTAARLFAREPGTAGRAQTIAARAFARLAADYPVRANGLSLVPRAIDRRSYRKGVDVESLGFNGLTLWMLDQAIDVGPAHAAALPLTADRDGWFLDPDQQRFAAVRAGPVWYVVHAKGLASDLRGDFGLVALKLRTASGRWVDLVRPRPFVPASTDLPSGGPVEYERDGGPLVPLPGRLSITRGGGVAVTTRFAPFGARVGAGGAAHAPTTLRFTPGPSGVTLRFLAPPGGRAAMTTFVPAGEGRASGGSVADRAAVATLAPAGSLVARRGLASCCDADLAALTVESPDGVRGGLTYTVRARLPGERFGPLPSGGVSGLERVLLICGAVALMGVAVLVRRRA